MWRMNMERTREMKRELLLSKHTHTNEAHTQVHSQMRGCVSYIVHTRENLKGFIMGLGLDLDFYITLQSLLLN